MTKSLYSTDDIRKTYEIIHDHKFTREIIARYSRNKADVRTVALAGVNLSQCRTALDLGCGYGLFVEKLRGRLPREASITGVDVIESNRAAFLRTVEDIGYTGSFIKGPADLIRDMPAASFDLIVASYSLYFFPHLIGEIARVVKPDGLFITITHSRFSLQEITDLIPGSMAHTGINPPEKISIRALFDAFSLEDGPAQLRPYFTTIETIPYPNAMHFPLEDINACIRYLSMKRHLLFKDVADNHPGRLDDVQTHFYQSIHHAAHAAGGMTITKDDVVFRCSHPCPNHAKAEKQDPRIDP